ncbi:MAG: DNA-binding protein [Candidatus Marsarchaeota archaeon]|jgi:programmed cell death protein 5|nr:DNA-binding protein [Candidatus Marsarchaeota archaeon]
MPDQQGSEEDKYRKEMAKRIKAMQAEQQKREIAKKFLTNEAYERLMNVRISNRDLYTQLISLIIQMAQSSRIQGKLTDEQLKSLLARLTYRPEPTIEFKHK